MRTIAVLCGKNWSVEVHGTHDAVEGLRRQADGTLPEAEAGPMRVYGARQVEETPERQALLRALTENAQLNDNLTSAQARCGELLLKYRAARAKIVESGGEDPGPP